MAVQVQFITIVVPIERINASSEDGGFAGLLEREADFVGKRFWHDEHLYATAVMNPMDAQDIMEEWEAKGLVGRTGTDEARRWSDLCVIDYYHGPTLRCDWLEWDANAHCVWMKGTDAGSIVKPENQHEANPLLVTPAMMQKLTKPWWKLW